MKLKSILISAVFSFFCLPSLGQNKKNILFPPPVIEYPDFTAFCNAPLYSGQIIYTRVIYYNKKDSWRVKAPSDSCTSVEADLYFSDEIATEPKYVKMLRSVRHDNKKACLIIDAIGIIEKNTPNEILYDHISRDADLKYRFVINRICDIQVVNQ